MRPAPSPLLLRRLAGLCGAALLATALGGCAVVSVAGAAAGAAISVTGAVVSTGVKVTGAVVEAAVSDDEDD
ncbi:hypothetical protein [Caldimonas brevitalea]|uniref:Lipoprotein n=1 Tax=Caldimonas brevitalea TaxID=413882 RepID=A0A0G3BRD4_9BURK|nr:hypothetical protein [Caldimonas brevitalea]AKJ30548.1 hypothetical protein AAW51_3857 [Caldimonas brevitalea]